MSCFARRSKVGQSSCYAPAWIGLLVMDSTRFQRESEGGVPPRDPRRQRDLVGGDGRGPIPTTSDSAADRQAEEISLPEADGDSCSGADQTERPREDRLEADHKSFCSVAQRRIRKARLVRDALEDRDVPQDPEVRL